MSSHNSESEISETEMDMSKKTTTQEPKKVGRPKKVFSLTDLPPKDQEKAKEKFAKARMEGNLGLCNKMKILKKMEMDEKHLKLDEAINKRAERIAEIRACKEQEAKAKQEESEKKIQSALAKVKEEKVKAPTTPYVVPEEEEIEIEYRKIAKPKKKKIVYVEDSSSESEEEIVVKKPKKAKKAKKVVAEEEEDDENLVKQEILKREVKNKVDTMRDEVLRSYMNSFFPRM